MTSGAQWWDSIDRAEVLAALQALLLEGGCLVLEGDAKSGRRQAADLAESELRDARYDVLRVRRNRTPWTAFEALADSWSQLQGCPVGYRLTADSQLSGRPIPSITQELAGMLKAADPRRALLIEDIDRDGARDYGYRRVFHPLARQSERPLVLTYEPVTSRWPTAAHVLRLRDFSRRDVEECLARCSPLWPKPATQSDLNEALELVFGGRGSSSLTVRPLTAYIRLQTWWEAR